MAKVKCKKHPRYLGKGKPKSKCADCWEVWVAKNPDPKNQVDLDMVKRHHSAEKSGIEKKYREALGRNQILINQVEAIRVMKGGYKPYAILPKVGDGNSETTPILICSDWHYEEKVDPKTVSGLNSHNLKEAKEKGVYCFHNGLKVIRIFGQKTKIKTVVLALLGDFISNSIHEELMESNQLPPMQALLEVMNCLYSGIDMFLEQTNYDLVIPCCYGNHGRTTKERRHSTAAGNSLEWLMYNLMAQHYIDLKQNRVKFLIADGYHLYLDIYGKSIRFHHGDDVRYQGGVGGIYIPVNKAIAQWNKGRHADLDIFGHWHQFRDGGNFVCNGSLIGYNSYALSIKADYEEPIQGLIFRDKDLGTTGRFPIFLKQT